MTDYDLAIFSQSALRLCPEPVSGLNVDTKSSSDSDVTVLRLEVIGDISSEVTAS